MEESIQDKLAKVYRLVNSGSTEGEREAAKHALDRLLKKYNLDESVINNIDHKVYEFKYHTELELKLIIRIMSAMVPDSIEKAGVSRQAKYVRTSLLYMDFITIECAYQYFKRHMKAEYKRIIAPELSKLRKAKTKRKRRQQISKMFFNRYVIASKLYREEELDKAAPAGKMTKQEYEDLERLMAVQGGQYNKQIIGNLLLTN